MLYYKCMAKKFTHLHVHSHYSLLDGLSKIPELVDYVKKLGMDSVALTDHGVLYGAVEFFKEAKNKGVKPIIGCEMYVACDGMYNKRANIDDKRYHLVLLVKNEKGYENLVRLVTKAHLEGFYYKPRIDDKLLAKHAEGLIAMTACIQGEVPRLILRNRMGQAEQKALKYQQMFGPGNFYLELQHHPEIKEQVKVNKGLIKISRKHDVPLVATNDSHYLKPEDAEAQDILMLINTNADRNDPERMTMISGDFSIRSPQKMADDFKETPQAIENTQKIKKACNFEFDLGRTIIPSFKAPEEMPNKDYLRKLCREGIKKRYGSNPPKELDKRLREELSVINSMGFTDYFLIVQDLTRWAKEQNIAVGPGRGSAGGCLVSYLLGITNIDPLKYSLIFERFLNKGRVSMPDIDLDFADTRRDEVIDYVRKKYGKDKVAQIITFGTMAARGVIRDVGRALGHSYNYCDRVAKMIPFGFTLEKTLDKVPEFRNLYKRDEKAKKLIDFGQKLEGVARHASTHACAVVISKEPLDRLVPLQHPSQNDKTVVTQYEMHSSEDIGLLKMDFLGLKNLTIIEKTIDLVQKIHGQKIGLDSLPLDDKKTFELIQEGKTSCVFQLESGGMKRYLKLLRPTKFSDITAMVALYRPGPIDLIPKYIRRKHGKEKVKYLHPKLELILEETYGIMVYQEQLIQMAQKLAGFSLSEADILRKAVGKKIRSLLRKQEKKFINGCLKNDVSKSVAEKLWKLILPFARYGFNKAHAAAYATIAYQTAYLKAHYPVEFMAAVFASENADVERTAFLIEECRSMGIQVLPPDINESFSNFTVIDKDKIRFGLEAVKNVGSAVVEEIVSERKQNGPFKSMAGFVTRVNSRSLNKKSMESLIKAGAFDKLEERNKLLSNLENLLRWARRQHNSKKNGQRSLFGSSETFNSNIRLEQAPPATKKERLQWEKELLGLYVSSHPLEKFTNKLKEKAFPIAEIGHYVTRRVRVGGIISRTKKILTKNGNPMLFATVEDRTDKIEVVVFPNSLRRHSEHLREEKVVLISGKVDMRDGTPKIICEEVEELES